MRIQVARIFVIRVVTWFSSHLVLPAVSTVRYRLLIIFGRDKWSFHFVWGCVSNLFPLLTRGSVKVMLSVMFLQIVITVTMKCTYIIGTFLQRLDCLCTNSPSTDFPVFAWDVCCKRKTLRWSIGVLHARSVSSRRRLKNCVFGVHPSGGRKDWSRMVLNRDSREDERGQSTLLLQLPRLCADWWALWVDCGTSVQHSFIATKDDGHDFTCGSLQLESFYCLATTDAFPLIVFPSLGRNDELRFHLL